MSTVNASRNWEDK